MRQTTAIGISAILLATSLALASGVPPVGAQAAEPTAPATTAAPEAAVANDWRSVSVGQVSACGIKTTGRLYCWGGDAQGTVGDGAPFSGAQRSAVMLAGGATNWDQISVGGLHACAIKTTGRLYCWGDDSDGQLGDGGSNTDQPRPVEVGGTRWVAVSAGREHTCARKSTGSIFCWGDDLFDQLGIGPTETDRDTPVRVGAASDWTSVTAGGVQSCGRRASGRVYCWGADSQGAVGDGGVNSVRVSTPAEIAGGATDWATVVAGDGHTCARKANNRLYCWGDDADGQLGDGGTNTAQGAPTEVDGATADWAGVAPGDSHTCARRTTGELFCWGADDAGALGDGGGEVDSGSPVGVSGAASDWRSVDTGLAGSCARKNAGRLLCWGSDFLGKLGTGSPVDADSDIPVEVRDATDFAAVASGGAHSCGRAVDGRLYCWGENDDGQLGTGGGPGDEALPVEVSGGVTTWTSITLGGAHTCGLRASGRLYCWGDDSSGQVGDGGGFTPVGTPVQVAGGFTDWTSVSAGLQHTCARREVGRLYCWGDDGSGRLGDGGGDTNQPAPVEVSGASTLWANVAAGDEHTCASRNNGRLFCWGADGDGQLGTGGGASPTSAPVQVSGGGTNWTAPTAGAHHTCARKLAGRLYCWGDDADGQLGNGGSATDAQAPVEVSGAALDWAAVEAGAQHTCARKDSGRLLCWGDDTDGRLGDGGADSDQSIPVEVSGGLTAWSSVSAGGAHTCARLSSKRLFCWGADVAQQTGADLNVLPDPSPVQVLF